MLWNHKKLHTSQTPQSAQNRKCGLTTIQNYTPLKLISNSFLVNVRLTTIQNYTPLKPMDMGLSGVDSLTTIKNYTPLKPVSKLQAFSVCFTTI